MAKFDVDFQKKWMKIRMDMFKLAVEKNLRESEEMRNEEFYNLMAKTMKEREKPVWDIRCAKKIVDMVQVERERQNDKWGIQRHDMKTWLMILMEEVGEVAQAGQQGMVSEKATDKGDMLKELIQVQAVAQAMAEQVLEEMEEWHG